MSYNTAIFFCFNEKEDIVKAVFKFSQGLLNMSWDFEHSIKLHLTGSFNTQTDSAKFNMRDRERERERESENWTMMWYHNKTKPILIDQ